MTKSQRAEILWEHQPEKLQERSSSALFRRAAELQRAPFPETTSFRMMFPVPQVSISTSEKLRAKVADFGFAHLGPEDPEATHISTQIKGTAGYVDPEYLRTYQLTEKSDVYSFGVLLVELVTGRRPIERHRDLKDRATTRWAIQRFKEGDAVMAMDPRMRRSPAAIMVVEKMMGLAFECLAPSRRSRPSMKKCGEVLWGIRKDYREMQAGSPSPWATPRSRSGSGGGGGRSSEREGVTPANIGR